MNLGGTRKKKENKTMYAELKWTRISAQIENFKKEERGKGVQYNVGPNY